MLFRTMPYNYLCVRPSLKACSNAPYGHNDRIYLFLLASFNELGEAFYSQIEKKKLRTLYKNISNAKYTICKSNIKKVVVKIIAEYITLRH